MFGNKNRMSSDEILEMKNKLEASDTFARNVEKSSDILDTNLTEITESCSRTAEYANQVADNVSSTIESSKSNIDVEASLIHSLDEYGNAISKTQADIEKLVEKVKEQNEEALKLVDNNKHFTSPSKYF